MPKTKSFASSPDELVDRLLTGQPPKKKLDEPVEPIDHPVERLIKILKQFFLKNKESNKKNGTRFWVRMRKIWSKQTQVPHIRTWSYKLQLKWSFGETSLHFFSMMWKTRELAMTALRNELHTRTTLDCRWTYTRLEKTDQAQKGAWRCHTKKVRCMWHP